jgi:signal transduction histidine kinase
MSAKPLLDRPQGADPSGDRRKLEGPQLDEVEAILLEREARGLRVPIIARIALYLFGLVNVSLAMRAEAMSWLIWTAFAVVFGGSIAVNVYLWVLLRRRQRVELVGNIGVAFDALLLFAMIGSIQYLGATMGLSSVYLWKTELVVMPALIIAINGLALRPRYPIAVTVAATLAQLVGFVVVLLDPATRLVSDPSAVGVNSVDEFQIPNAIVFVAGVGLAVIFMTAATRKMLRRAIASQLENARLQREQVALLMREKIRALGKLVAGVSHEINTPVGVIVSGVDTQSRAVEKIKKLVAEQAQSNTRLARVLEIAQDTSGSMAQAAARIAKTEETLRTFAHLDEADIQKVDLHREIDNALELVPRKLRGETRVETSYDELPELHVHVREIGQAIMTIVRNAFEATKGEGTLTLGTRHDPEANQVVLSIGDDGPGIPDERLETLFDIGLRQKDNTMTAGFGLPSAHSVVLRHGGQLSVESRLGLGTTFTIRLPVG